jgi:chromosome segregation ATPase
MPLTRILAATFAVAITLCCVCSAPTFAQTGTSATGPQNDPDQTLKQLLTEVRELRLALQRSTANTSRFQMLIERLRVEQTHVDVMRRDLETVRAQLSELQSTKPRIEQQIKEAQDELDRTTDPNAHTSLESHLKEVKANLARVAPEEERLRTRETALDGEFQSSQMKVNELNGQLDALMNEMKAP